MRYLGGKSRISKQISEVINNAIHGREISYFNNITMTKTFCGV